MWQAHSLPAHRFLSIPGIVFGGLMRVRNALYSAGCVPQRRLPRPVISVGNLTLGGTGKTPFSVLVAELLSRLDAVPAFLSRGYGRESTDDVCVVAPGDVLQQPARRIGDEPALVRRKVPGVWMGISKDRYSAGLEILRRGVKPVFVLDDGYQHLKLHRDLDVLLLDVTQPLDRNRVFPGGSLREPLTGIRRANIIVIHDSGREDSAQRLKAIARGRNPEARVLTCSQRVDSLIPISAWLERASPPVGSRVSGRAYLVAAVGNPYRFRLAAEDYGLLVQGCRFFRDHHRISSEDWKECSIEAKRVAADFLLTTEKDAIKLEHEPPFPLFVALQSTRLPEAAEFEGIIRSLIACRK